MWWGDAVTLNEWPSIWLNEGFAVYSEALWAEYFTGPAEFRGYMEYAKGVYLDRTRDRDFPIYDPDPLFHYGITYKKGGWVLHMLRHVVGDDHFFTILKTYYVTYLLGNASIADFQTVCENVSGMDLEWFFQQWIYDQGYPKVQYAWESRPQASGTHEVTIYTNQFQTNGPLFRMPLDVRIQGVSSTVDDVVLMENDFDTYTVTVNFNPIDVLIDPDGWILMDKELTVGGIRRDDLLPSRFALYRNYPNPFNASTTIHYNVPYIEGLDWEIGIYIYDLLGRKVRTLFEGVETPGTFKAIWDGKDDQGVSVSSGVYFIELYTEGYSKKRKAVLVR
jgi:hypothetical protein